MTYWRECNASLRWGYALLLQLFSSKALRHLILLEIMISIVFGILLFIVDPNISSLVDGVWSAWVTMTHVGFGDVVPTSFFGRLLASILILFGILLFAVFTALVSVILLKNSKLLFDDTQPEE